MEVILVDDVFGVGKRGEVVKVAKGFGRNYLIPRKLALVATPGNLKAIEQRRLAMSRKETKDREEAELLARQLAEQHLVISRKTGDSGLLFGSVTSKDLGDVLESGGFHLDRRKILLPQPIKSIGNFTVEARPHSEVKVELLVSVLAEGDVPVAKLIPRNEESERIVQELEVRVSGLEPSPSSAKVAAGKASTRPEPEKKAPQAAANQEKEAK